MSDKHPAEQESAMSKGEFAELTGQLWIIAGLLAAILAEQAELPVSLPAALILFGMVRVLSGLIQAFYQRVSR